MLYSRHYDKKSKICSQVDATTVLPSMLYLCNDSNFIYCALNKDTTVVLYCIMYNTSKYNSSAAVVVAVNTINNTAFV